MTFDAKKIASAVEGYLQDAVGDMANEMCQGGSGFNDDKWDKKIAKAKKAGVRDIQGWLADELYNDADTLQDLMGDKIYDELHIAMQKDVMIVKEGYDDNYDAVVDILDNGYPGRKKACKAIRHKPKKAARKLKSVEVASESH